MRNSVCVDGVYRVIVHFLEKAMAPHSSTLAWEIPWMEEPGGLQSMRSLGVGHDWADFTFMFHFHALEEKMAAHSSILAWWIPGTVEPGGLLSMGSHRVGHDLTAAAAVHFWMVEKTFCFFSVRKHLTGGFLCTVLDLSGILCSLLIPEYSGIKRRGKPLPGLRDPGISSVSFSIRW